MLQKSYKLRVKKKFLPHYEETRSIDRAFVLFRVIFEMPERASDGPSMASWLAYEGYNNADGTKNLSWPISWKDGRPRLLQEFRGLSNPIPSLYAYIYLRASYPFRDLSNIQFKE